MRLLKDQQRVASGYFDTTIYLDGIAGTGKTTAAIERVKELIRSGVPADSILIWVPQANLAMPYRRALQRARIDADTNVPTTTIGKLAYEMTDLFWPLISDDEKFNFGDKFGRPNFLSLELVQYYMTKFLGPEIELRDYFNSVHISRNRLYTQIVDNLNKAALVRFEPDKIGDRLKDALGDSVEQSYIYDDAQETASLFRQRCLEHNLLDFSLQVELFVNHLWPLEQVQNYLTRKYRHLIVDNVEEDTPASHDILRDWLPQTDSALLISDTGGGYRRFLGADPINAETLCDQCQVHITLDNHRVMSKELVALHDQLDFSLDPSKTDEPQSDADARDAIAYAPDINYQPQMIAWAAEHIASLVHDQGVPASEIVIMAPYMPDALRFSLQRELDAQQVPHRSHRPSRALREETASRTLLTLARLAHPHWNLPPNKFDVGYALAASINELDLIRARLLADVLYRNGKLAPFTGIKNDALTQRITFDLGMRYQVLFDWLQAYQAQDPLPLDIFFSKLFGEVLSQKGFGFHGQTDAANIAANLIDSAQAFRQTVSEIEPNLDIPTEYVKMVEEGVIANQYLRDWEDDQRDAVLIAPAYTFLLTNQPVDYQFWLNVGSSGWAQRLYQPLTHPYVLSRQWQSGRRWTENEEDEAHRQTLAYMALGLIRRCRKQIYLGFSQYSEQGYEQRGDLLMAIQTMLRRLNRSDAHA
ncbi:MAG: AAA family ATPase [Anaerolineaceae bacterium]|nr:AAA family ATPase [Anaerolineaceae bacterium]